MTEFSWIEWYQSLAKPSWTPAPRTISLIWQILYTIIIATFGYGIAGWPRPRCPTSSGSRSPRCCNSRSRG
ncbi:MAG: tryptophan-rich sensory protein [Planctomycetota bacterium]